MKSFLLLCCCAALTAGGNPTVTSSAEARTILGVEAGVEAADLKKAYKVAALKAHPDKGGSQAEFIRVTQAYELLKGGGGGGGGGGNGGGGGGGGGTAGMNNEEALKYAFEMFEETLGGLDAMFDGDLAADMVDKAIWGEEGAGWGFGAVMRWGLLKAVRTAAPALGTMMSDPNARVTINGQTMSGSEFKQMREKSKAKREAKTRAKLDGSKTGDVARDEM